MKEYFHYRDYYRKLKQIQVFLKHLMFSHSLYLHLESWVPVILDVSHSFLHFYLPYIFFTNTSLSHDLFLTIFMEIFLTNLFIL